MATHEGVASMDPMKIDKNLKKDVEQANKLLKDSYVGVIINYQEIHKKDPSSGQLKVLEELLKSFERVIVFYDGNDRWLQDLHNQAKSR